MARTAVSLQEPTRAGLTPTFTPAIADGHMFSNNGRTILRFKNTGSATTATIRFGGSVDGTAISGGKTVTLPGTTGDVITSVWPPSDYNQSDGTVWIDYVGSPPTGVSVAVLAV